VGGAAGPRRSRPPQGRLDEIFDELEPGWLVDDPGPPQAARAS